MKTKRIIIITAVCIVILSLLLYFFLRQRKTEQIVHTWQMSVNSLHGVSATPYYGYICIDQTEYFVRQTADGTRSCGKRDLASGYETLYFDDQQYLYLTDSSEPTVTAMDTGAQFQQINEEILGNIEKFMAETVENYHLHRQGLFEIDEPVFCIDVKQTVILSLGERFLGKKLSTDSFAHLSCVSDNRSTFTFNMSSIEGWEIKGDAMLLLIGESPEHWFGWLGHVPMSK